jgi:hypothetical protein
MASAFRRSSDRHATVVGMPANPTLKRASVAVAVAAALTLAGCGGTASSSSSASTPGSAAGVGTSTAASSSGSAAGGGAGALSADAKSAATGDVPDTQVFITFNNTAAGWSMKYPEGWTQTGSRASVTFSDKNNLVHVLVGRGAAPTVGSVAAQLQALKSSRPSLSFTAPTALTLPSGAAVKATYTTRSAPNPVTGKRVTLIVDRYVVGQGSRVATVDLGTPRGVDNVDAYRMMIRSFRWR